VHQALRRPARFHRLSRVTSIPMPMREDCRHYQSRTYASGEVARFCVLDMAPDCRRGGALTECPVYERRLADAGWTHEARAASSQSRRRAGSGRPDLLRTRKRFVSAIAPDAIDEARKRERKEEAASARVGFGCACWFKRKVHRHPVTVVR